MKRNSNACLLFSALAAGTLFWTSGCASTQTPPPATVQDAADSEARPADGQPRPQAKKRFDDAMSELESQKAQNAYDWAALEQKFQAAVAADSEFAEAHYNLGVVHERMNQPEQAMADYRRALQLKPYFRAPAENLAALLVSANRAADAMALMQDILKVYPNDGGARAKLAAIYQRAGDTKQAMHFAREALMRDPKSLEAYKVMMRCYMDRNNLDMARLVALRAMKLKADDPELFYTMGMILEREDDQPGAIFQYLKATQIRDDFLHARTRIAQIATKNSDWATAAAQYEKIVHYAPGSLEAHLNLGICYKGMGDTDRALQEYDLVLKAPEPLAGAYYAKGVLLQVHRDDPKAAMENYREFVAKARPTPPANHAVYGRIRDCEQAIRDAEAAKAEEERAAKMAEEEKKREEEQKRREEAKKKAELEAQEAAEKAKEDAEKAERQKAAQAILDGGSQAKEAESADGNGGAAASAQPAAAQGGTDKKADAAGDDGADDGDDGDDGDEDDDGDDDSEEPSEG